MRRIACGISGGVDSSIAALLLLRKGFDVIGVFMRNWDQIEEDGICSADRDYEDGFLVCKKLGIPLVEVNFVKEYWNLVFSELLNGYSRGLTPNPDVLCNRYIKFDAFYNHCINRLNVDAIATGHYARTSFGLYLERYVENKNVKLLQARDQFQDQTFFLSRSPQSGLRRCLFPLGELSKSEVRQLADDAKLTAVARKKASAGICFVGQRNFQKFIGEYLDDRPGDFIDIDTRQVVGYHRGIHQWTIGQRCRLQTFPKPYFVARKDVATGHIFVAQGHDHPFLYSTEFLVDNTFWIDGSPPNKLTENQSIECKFRFQHTHPLVRCRMEKTTNDNQFKVVLLDGPLRALTPGQYSVFYDGEVCLGSAQIIQIEQMY